MSHFSSENYYFYSREILQYIARTCLRNGFFITLAGFCSYTALVVSDLLKSLKDRFSHDKAHIL